MIQRFYHLIRNSMKSVLKSRPLTGNENESTVITGEHDGFVWSGSIPSTKTRSKPCSLYCKEGPGNPFCYGSPTECTGKDTHNGNPNLYRWKKRCWFIRESECRCRPGISPFRPLLKAGFTSLIQWQTPIRQRDRWVLSERGWLRSRRDKTFSHIISRQQFKTI